MASYTSPSRMLSGLLPLWQITGSRDKSARESERVSERKELARSKLQDFLACSLYIYIIYIYIRMRFCTNYILSMIHLLLSSEMKRESLTLVPVFVTWAGG